MTRLGIATAPSVFAWLLAGLRAPSTPSPLTQLWSLLGITSTPSPRPLRPLRPRLVARLRLGLILASRIGYRRLLLAGTLPSLLDLLPPQFIVLARGPLGLTASLVSRRVLSILSPLALSATLLLARTLARPLLILAVRIVTRGL
ncbi:MAG: hypothetical protein M3457_20020 [Chloroflexota bacterium]|nr:hypothetical protein [Chloroflexota bacterium]